MNSRIETLKTAQLNSDDVLFIFRDNGILVAERSEQVRLPIASEINLNDSDNASVFRLEGGWALSASSLKDQSISRELQFRPLRDTLTRFAIPIAKDAALGAQLVNWSVAAQFCGTCGNRLEFAEKQVAKFCPKCSKHVYPQLSPVVITLIRRGREILLIKSRQRSYFSCVAGFVEPGESLEECIRREVREETGLEIRNLKYFGSQPWPFPNNLMVGFTADWVAGEIKREESELSDARWFDRDQLPDELPPKSSISRQLIDSAR